MSNKQVIALNTISQVVGKLITSGTTFIVSMLLAKTLGSQGYGDFTKITTLVAFFYLFADFGLNASYLELADKKESLCTLYVLRLTMSIILILILLSLLNFLPGTTTQGYSPFVKLGIILYSISILLQAIITTTNAIFQKNLRYDFASYALTAGSLSTLLVLSIVSYTHSESVLLFISSLLAGAFVTAITSIVLSKKFLGEIKFSVNMSQIQTMISIAIPLGITLLCNVVYSHADSIILTLSKSTSDVGIYGFAYKLFEFPLVIPTFFMNSVFPLFIVSLKQKNTRAFVHQAKQAAAILLSQAFVIATIGYVAAPAITLIKSDFAQSIDPLRVLLIGLPVFYGTGLTMWMLVALKKRTALLFIYFSSMVINIIANVLLVPSYGYMASAWITVYSEVYVLVASLLVILTGFRNPNTVKLT